VSGFRPSKPVASFFHGISAPSGRFFACEINQAAAPKLYDSGFHMRADIASEGAQLGMRAEFRQRRDMPHRRRAIRASEIVRCFAGGAFISSRDYADRTALRRFSSISLDCHALNSNQACVRLHESSARNLFLRVE
jgi:hypothetical protein